MAKRQKKAKASTPERARRTNVTAASAGCNECDKAWKGANAVSCAARHHDASGHTTWAEQVLYIEYGPKPEVVPTEAPAEAVAPAA